MVVKLWWKNRSIATGGALTATLGNLSNGYGLFENVEEFDIDFLLMGSGSKGRK